MRYETLEKLLPYGQVMNKETGEVISASDLKFRLDKEHGFTIGMSDWSVNITYKSRRKFLSNWSKL